MRILALLILVNCTLAQADLSVHGVTLASCVITKALDPSDVGDLVEVYQMNDPQESIMVAEGPAKAKMLYPADEKKFSSDKKTLRVHYNKSTGYPGTMISIPVGENSVGILSPNSRYNIPNSDKFETNSAMTCTAAW